MKPMSAFSRVALGIGLCILALAAGGGMRIVQDTCGPFTDVTPGFCPYVLELYYLGITVGTSATTFSPDDPLTRGQAAVFVSKGLNQTLARSSRRAALGQWWTSGANPVLGGTPVGTRPIGVASDGADLWVANIDSATVSRVRASDGRLLETWTGAISGPGRRSWAMVEFHSSERQPFGRLDTMSTTRPALRATIGGSQGMFIAGIFSPRPGGMFHQEG